MTDAHLTKTDERIAGVSGETQAASETPVAAPPRARLSADQIPAIKLDEAPTVPLESQATASAEEDRETTASKTNSYPTEAPGKSITEEEDDMPEYADASHWMHSVSADSTDEAESGTKINLTDIDLTAVAEDEVIPDKGTAHTLGRKVNIALCAVAFIVLFGYLFIAGEGEDTLRALTSFNYLFLLLALVFIVVYWLLESVCMQIICNSLYKGFSFFSRRG